MNKYETFKQIAIPSYPYGVRERHVSGLMDMLAREAAEQLLDYRDGIRTSGDDAIDGAFGNIATELPSTSSR